VGTSSFWQRVRRRKLPKSPRWSRIAVGDLEDGYRRSKCFVISRHVSWQGAVVLLLGFVWLAIVGSLQHFSIATALLDVHNPRLATWKLTSLQTVCCISLWGSYDGHELFRWRHVLFRVRDEHCDSRTSPALQQHSFSRYKDG